MKVLLCTFILAITGSACLTGQVSFANLTGNRSTCDTIYVAINNQVLLKGNLKSAVDFYSDEGRVTKNGDTLICCPVTQGKMRIHYRLAGNKNSLAFYATVLPAPELVITASYGAVSKSSIPSKSHEISLKKSRGLYSGYRVVSCSLTIGGEHYIIEGSTIPSGLMNKAVDADGRNRVVVEYANLVNDATLRKMRINGHLQFNPD